jgi:trimeric autotransporter adhesin
MHGQTRRNRFRTMSALALTLAVAGCGGGGSDGDDAPPASNAVTLTGRVADGPIQGATACYDLNDNRVCDAGEPRSTSPSDAAGNFTIAVDASVAGAHRIIVEVPASAIDADTGQPVGTAFALVAPASGSGGAQSVFVSPLTTLVQQQMDATGQTRADAATFVQAQAGLTVSPLADFTAAQNTDNARAALTAKLVLQTTQQQAAAVAPAVGQPDLSGAPVTQADLDRAVQARVIAALPSIATVAADPALAALTGTAREQAAIAAAAQVVAQIAYTPDQVRFDAGLARLPQVPAGAPSAGANMPALQYTDAHNWFYRANVGTEADNTPDASGRVRFYSFRTRMTPYANLPQRGVAETVARTFNPELHWNGSAWVDCRLGQRDSSTVRDAQGRSAYTACDLHEAGTSQRAEVDIAGQSLASVWTDRLLPAAQQANLVGVWTLPDVALLGNGVFPAGSRLQLQTNTVTDSAVTYNTVDSNRVGVAPAAVAQGGDARTGSPACAATTTQSLGITLELMVERNPGRPCVFGPSTDANGTSLDPNEIWGNTSVSLGTLSTSTPPPAGTGTHYTTTRLLRAAFTGGNAVTYLSCLQRTANLFTRNCTPLGTGTFAISTLGEARVMTFANLPPAAQSATTQRVFVERAGQVWFGYRVRVGLVSPSVRLNLPAANAVLEQLRLPVITPTEAPQPLSGAKAANAAQLAGVWYFDDPSGSGILRFDAAGRYVSAVTDAPADRTRPGVELGWLEIDGNGRAQRVLQIDSDGEDSFSHNLANSTFTVTADTLSGTTAGVTESVQRFPDSGNGLMGVWSTSATDLAAPTFAFLPSGRMISVHPYAETSGPCAAARQGSPGVEAAPYTFNATTGALSIGPRTLDTTGCTGLWDAGVDAADAIFQTTATFAADGRSVVFTLPEGGTVTMLRIAVR